MTNKEILEKAITKAIDGGWDGRTRGYQFFTENKDAVVAEITDNPESINDVIFNHDFAKALWGDEGFTTTGLKCDKHPGVRRYWQYNLQQMVIADDPIKYLGENI